MMEMQVIYTGEFLALNGTRYRVDILRDASQSQGAEELTFERETPLTIEWAENATPDAVIGSTATLRIESPGDRTFIDLYTVKPGAIRMDVWRTVAGGRVWARYWSGALDPEFYEEPYERYNMYPVSLTFTDFGILNRIDFEGEGMMSIADLVADAIAKTGINVAGINTSRISTQIAANHAQTVADLVLQQIDLAEIYVNTDNFFDEGGEPMDYATVLEGVLKPLGLKIQQRQGAVFVFDLNGIHDTPSTQIYWTGTSSKLGVAEVYQKVSINYSPYAYSGNMLDEECYDGYSDDATWHGDDRSAEAGEYHCIYFEPQTYLGYQTTGQTLKTKNGAQYVSIPATNEDVPSPDRNVPVGFTMWLSAEGYGCTLPDGVAAHSTPKFFKMISGYSETDAEGIALFFRTRGMAIDDATHSDLRIVEFSQGPMDMGYLFDKREGRATDVLLRTNDVFISTPGNIEVDLPILFSYLPNPFEGEIEGDNVRTRREGYDHAMWEEVWKSQGQILKIPIRIIIHHTDRPDDVHLGKLIYGKTVDTDGGATFAGSWTTATRGEDSSSQWTPSGTRGYITHVGCGPMGARISIEVLASGWEVGHYDDNGGWHDAYDQLMTKTAKTDFAGNILDHKPSQTGPKLCFALLKMPTLRYVGPYYEDYPNDDIEFATDLNTEAKESLDVDTICGTVTDVPSRGAMLINTPYSRTLYRGEAHGDMEDLLASTIYSQHAERHTTLTGEVAIDREGGVHPYIDANQGTRRFRCVSLVEDLIEGTADAKFVELSPDQYQKADEQDV